MKLYYKLTDQDMKTRTGEYNEHQWEMRVKNEIRKDLQCQKQNLCKSSWFHVYSHPLLAILLNPIHAGIINPRLFRCICSGLHKSDNGLKEGFTIIKLTSEMQVPKITSSQKIAFGILCTKKVYFKKDWVNWANNWLENNNKGYNAAYAAANTANAANAAYTAYAANAANAAYTANAAYAANVSVNAAYAAANAAYAANVSVNAAYAATNAAYAANVSIHTINLAKIAKQAMKY